MRNSAKETIKDCLKAGRCRLHLHEIDDSDLKKVKEHLQKALEEVEKELD